jgi:hypothetical protein
MPSSVERERCALHPNSKPELNERVATFDKTSDWIEIATDAGFALAADEFHSVIEEAIGKKVTTENTVSTIGFP